MNPDARLTTQDPSASLRTGSQLTTDLKEAIQLFRAKIPADFAPETALVLGSGLSDLAARVQPVCALSYREIPGFISTKVSGHAGQLIAGILTGKKLLLLSGRNHFYEGYPLQQVTFPIRFLAKMGIKKLILTSAVGAINKKIRVGDVVVVKDHINAMGTNPLIGPHDTDLGERFPDMSECYSKSLQKLAILLARKKKISACTGVYFGLSGPSYETPSEIRAFKKLGGDIVGMSVVPETIVARQMGMDVLALCYAANMAAGVSKTPLRHEEVLQVGKKAAKSLSILIEEIIRSF